MGEEQFTLSQGDRDKVQGLCDRHYAKPTRQQLARRYANPVPVGDQARRADILQATLLATANLIVDLTPCSPEQARALNALDQALFLSLAAVARHEGEEA